MRRTLIFAAVLSLEVTACDGTVSYTSSGGDVGDDTPGADEAQAGTLAVPTFNTGQLVQVCGSDVNQRSGPGTTYSVLRVIPVGTTLTIVAQSGSWYKVDWSSRVGWSYGAYLCAQSGGGGPPPPQGGGGFNVTGLSRDNILSIAQASVGYTYWWGHGALGGSKTGACYGSCPSCTHDGQQGADCSGFVGKAWMLPEAMPIVGNDKHPFATTNFYNQSTHWSTISRGSVIRGDALTYNSGGAGHIFLYESGDGYGSMWAYEAKGCSYGIIHDLRTAGTAYKAIRRSGL
jgi:Bacterial SH3 domain